MSKVSTFKLFTSFSVKEVNYFFKNSKTVYFSSTISIRKQKNPSYELIGGKLLIIIPRAVGSAPLRNCYRRRIKHIFFEHQLYLSSSSWSIFITKSNAPLSYNELKYSMLDTIHKEVL